MNLITIPIARFYNWLPDRVKVYIYTGSSVLFSTFLGLLTRDILSLEFSNEYMVAFVLFVTGLINQIQKEVVEAGTKALVEQGSKTTIAKLETKVENTQELLKRAP